MHLKYFNISLLLVLVVSSVWLFWKAVPKRGFARTLFILARAFTVGVCLVILTAGILFCVSFQLLGNTTDELLFERESPDKLHIVAVFNRYGSAVVHNTAKVSLRSKWEKLDTRKNAIIFDEDLGQPIDVSWDGTNDLTIRTDLRHVSYQVTKWGDVTVTYVIK